MIRVVICDDEDVMRIGLRAILASTQEIEVVGEAGSGADAIAAVDALRPDVLVLDLVMPGALDGAATAARLRAGYPELGILILTTLADEQSVARVWRAGADGYLLKTASGEEMRQAVRSAARHRAVLSPDVISSVMARFSSHHHPAETPELVRRIEALSTQELRAALAVADGLGNREIAALLGTGEGSVKSFLSRGMHKLDLDNRTQLALLANDHRDLLRRTIARRAPDRDGRTHSG